MKLMFYLLSFFVKEGFIFEMKWNMFEGIMRLKFYYYLNNVLVKWEVGLDLNKEGIFLIKEGFLVEGIVFNLFFVKGDCVYMLFFEIGILNGIMR